MFETPSDVSPALITLLMSMVPSSPRSTWVVHIDPTHATQTPQFQRSVCKRSGQDSANIVPDIGVLHTVDLVCCESVWFRRVPERV
jgi:hypothetical protein